ncbi:MAG: translation initiation factor IF-6 [Candidatus Kariarchaeaceae archaeon]
MELNSIDLLGNSSIGIFGLTTNNYSLFPNNIKKNTLQTIKNTLQVPIVTTTIANSHLVGLFTSGNSNQILLPAITNDDELHEIKNNIDSDISINVLESKITALGNTIVCNDEVALVHPEFTQEEKNAISDYLDVSVESRYILNSPLIGSMVFLNNNGLLAHPLISEEELEYLTNYFKIPGDVVTVNRGTPYPRPGIIANQSGILVGSDTSGPELMRIYEILSAK